MKEFHYGLPVNQNRTTKYLHVIMLTFEAALSLSIRKCKITVYIVIHNFQYKCEWFK